MKYFLPLFFLLFSYSLYAQNSIDCIDLSEIGFKKVKQFINRQKANHVLSFKDVKATYLNSEKSTYFKHKQEYIIEKPLSEVWESYCSTSPAKSWNGRMIKFACLISKKTQEILYPQDIYHGAEVGQVLYINLKLLKGLYNLAVAFEITKISDKDKIIEYSYVDGGKTKGKQWLKMEPTPEGYTKITHYTLYKSNSELRDLLLYPYIHTLAITEFHENMFHSELAKYAHN